MRRVRKRWGGTYKTTTYPHLKRVFDVYKKGSPSGMLLSPNPMTVGRGMKRRRITRKRTRKGSSMKGFDDAMHVIGSIFGTASKLIPFIPPLHL